MARQKAKQQIFMLVSLVMFGGSTVAGAARLYSSAATQTTQPASQTSEANGLAEKATGFEMVLQREPNNQVALEGLANVRLQMQNAKGAIAPLEKLVKLYPDRADYATLLVQAKKAAKAP